MSFDLDGVVMEGPFSRGMRQRIRDHLTSTPALEGLAPEEAESRVQLLIQHEHRRRLISDRPALAWDWQEIYAEVTRALGGTRMLDVERLAIEACSIDGMMRLLPGALSGLDRLQAAGVRLVAITNGYRVFQLPVLRALGIFEYFEDLLTPDVVGYAKPDPRIFAFVPGLVAHVGDMLVHDVLGANLAGIRSVWLDPELPVLIRSLDPVARTQAAAFQPHLEAALERSVYRQYHEAATSLGCMPDAAVLDVDEAATVLLSWIE